MPTLVRANELPHVAGRLVLGVAGDCLEPISVDPFAGPARLLIAGPPRSGRSTLLRLLARQAHDAMASGSQKRHQGRTNEPGGSGDEHVQGPMGSIHLMKGQIAGGDRMPVAKQPLQFVPDKGTTQLPAEPSHGERILDFVFEDTSRRALRYEAMAVLPIRKRPFNLGITKLAARMTIMVPSQPAVPFTDSSHGEDDTPGVVVRKITEDTEAAGRRVRASTEMTRRRMPPSRYCSVRPVISASTVSVIC